MKNVGVPYCHSGVDPEIKEGGGGIHIEWGAGSWLWTVITLTWTEICEGPLV